MKVESPAAELRRWTATIALDVDRQINVIPTRSMVSITKGDRPMTVINVFTVAPEQQARLVELLRRATEASIRHVPGFVAAALHRSLDGTKVTMYAQWRTPDDYAQMRARPDSSPFLAEALTLARFDPGFYEVAEVFAPEASSSSHAV
jgi:quinol monooxygenase YgiN